MTKSIENDDARSRDEKLPAAGGPRTPTGKLRSRGNALKTGIFSRVVFKDASLEERKNYRYMLREVHVWIRPRDAFENFLTEALAIECLRLAQVYRVDAKIAPTLFHRLCEQHAGSGNGDAALAKEIDDEPLVVHKLPSTELLLKYESAVWRQIDRILDRLDRRLRASRSSVSREARPAPIRRHP
jgi:hypothetical protein